MDHRLESLKKTLRHRLRDADGDVALAAADLRLVLDELGRLQQGNDRLRRQNKKLRLKLGLVGEAPELGPDDADADAAEPTADGGASRGDD